MANSNLITKFLLKKECLNKVKLNDEMKHIINNFTPLGGKHCITKALRQIFCYTNHPLTEEMIFGVASGLAFTYLNLENSPMVSGRTKIFEFENKLAERLNITIKCKQPSNYDIAFLQVRKMIDNDIPVLTYVDMPFLSYLGLNKKNHFGGHAIVIFGYDDEAGTFYVSDRDNQDYAIRTPKGNISENYHVVSYEEMRLARNSRFKPFPANNKYIDFDFTNYRSITSKVIVTAILDTCQSMLNPSANLLGINGINKFAREVVKWKKFDSEKIKIAGITNYFQISKDGGTGGGIFRKMYGDFLIEAENVVPNIGLASVGVQYVELSLNWDLLADSMWKLGESGDIELLGKMSNQISELCEKEYSLLEKLKVSVR